MKVLIAGLLLWLFISVPFVVFAQDTAPANSGTSFPVLKEDYKKQLSTYRNDERQFTIAKKQYDTLKTLNALEDAVRATQKTMESRSVVLSTYMTMLRITLSETTGIDVQVKEAQIKKLDGLLEELKKHQLNSSAAADRTKLQQVATEFKTLYPKVSSAGYETLSMISYGKMQTVYDKTLAVTEEVQQYTKEKESNALKLAEKERGFEEIRRNLKQTGENLKKIQSQFAPGSDTRKEQYSSSEYSQNVEALNKVYADISRSISYLNEVLK